MKLKWIKLHILKKWQGTQNYWNFNSLYCKTHCKITIKNKKIFKTLEIKYWNKKTLFNSFYFSCQSIFFSFTVVVNWCTKVNKTEIIIIERQNTTKLLKLTTSQMKTENTKRKRKKKYNSIWKLPK